MSNEAGIVPTFPPEMIERAQVAMRRARFVGILTEPDVDERDKTMVTAALTAAYGREFVVVPREPTKEMIIAGCENNPTQWNDGTDDGFPEDVANDVYRAMIAASPVKAGGV